MVAGGVTTGLLLSNASATHSDVRRTTGTAVRHYQPWVDGAPAAGSAVITATANANCWEGSIVSPRADAYRCSTTQSYDGGNLFDPCFASPTDGHRMLCPSEPLGAKHLVAVTSSRPGPSNAPRTDRAGEPWEVALSGGVTCRLISGAAPMFRGLRANYVCSDGGWLWGDPNRSKPDWTMQVSRTGQPTRLETATVTAVWY